MPRDGGGRPDLPWGGFPRGVGCGVGDAGAGERGGEERAVVGLLRQGLQAGVLAGDQLAGVEVGQVVGCGPGLVLLDLALDLGL